MMNPENRNNITFMAPNRMQRRCSFCHRVGHNVSQCNHERLLEFEIMCANQVQITNTEFELESWIKENYVINEVNPILVRSFAVRYCGCTLRHSIEHCIMSICNEMFRKYKQNLHYYVEETIETENVETDIINLLINMRNSENEGINNIQEIPNLENIYMRDYAVYLLFNNTINEAFNHISENKKLHVVCLFEEMPEEKLKSICECNICYEEVGLSEFVKLNCNHEFCKNCLINSVKSDRRASPCCAFCRREIDSLTSRTLEVYVEIEKLVISHWKWSGW